MSERRVAWAFFGSVGRELEKLVEEFDWVALDHHE